MAITGQVSLARVGEDVKVFNEEEDINDIFDPAASPLLQPFDHVTLYPGDFTEIEAFDVPSDVYVTILPGAAVRYGVDNLGDASQLDRLSDRYRDIGGAVENVADLNLSSEFKTSVEKQYARVRVYIPEDQVGDRYPNPYFEYNTLDAAIETVNPGDEVIVFPGTYYPSKNLLVDDVSWKFLPGTKVVWDPDFERDLDTSDPSNNVYPHGLFDDSKDLNGLVDGSSKSANILGDATFVIGTEADGDGNGQRLLPRLEDSDYLSYYNDETEANSDWREWHKYSLLSISNNSSDVTFEARRVVVENVIDGVVKFSKCNSLDIDIDTVEVKSGQDAGENVKNIEYIDGTPLNPKVPAFFILNGNQNAAAADGDVGVDISNFVVETQNPFYLLTALNHSTTGDNERFAFDNGTLSFSVEEAETGENFEEAIGFAKHSPDEISVEDSKLLSPIVYEPNADSPTELIIKESEVSGGSDYALTVSGDATNFGISLSGAWLLSDANLSVKDDTDAASGGGSTNLEIKAYKNSFANKEIENFEDALHEEINNVIWTEDVESIR